MKSLFTKMQINPAASSLRVFVGLSEATAFWPKGISFLSAFQLTIWVAWQRFVVCLWSGHDLQVRAHHSDPWVRAGKKTPHIGFESLNCSRCGEAFAQWPVESGKQVKR